MRFFSILLTGSLLGAPVAGLAQASFDCGKARTPSEKAICAAPKLSALDRQVAAAYKAARSRVPSATGDRILSDQKVWLGERDECGAQPDCLANMMRYRIGQLQKEDGGVEGAAAPFTGVYCNRGGAEYLAVAEQGNGARITTGLWTDDGYACGTAALSAERKYDGYAVTDGNCTLTVFRRGDAVVISAKPLQACHDQYCGHRAWLGELIFAPSSRRPLSAPVDQLDFDSMCK